MKKLLIILNLLFVASMFGQSIGGTNTLSSKTNIQYQFNYEYKTGGSGGAFTNTTSFKTPTNTPWVKFSKNDDTNNYYVLIGTNSNIWLLESNSTAAAHNVLVISNDISGNMAIWSDSGVELGKTPDIGTPAKRWRIHGINSLFDGSTYGFMAATNVAITSINISGNTPASENSFISPSIITPGMYEVTATGVITQTCVGAVMHIGCVASNWSGFITNWMIPDLSLAALTNRSGSVVVSNVNHPLGYTAYVNAYSSGTALGYITFSVRQIQ